MAERLTKKETAERYETGYYGDMNKHEEIYVKLSKLEYVMERYGMSVEQLEHILEWLSHRTGKDAKEMEFIAQERKQIHDMYRDLEKDRDTWKKACERLGKKMKFYTGCMFCSFKNQECEKLKPVCADKIADYFYKQAKEKK